MTNAQAVSRVLRSGGFGVVPTRDREGMHISRSFNSVTVTAQFDSEKEAIRNAELATSLLRESGYKVVPNSKSAAILNVTKETR